MPSREEMLADMRGGQQAPSRDQMLADMRGGQPAPSRGQRAPSYWDSVIENAGPSTKKLLSGSWDAISHPVDTAEALGGLASGAAAKVGIGEGDTKSVDALMDYYAQRYGSVEGFQDAFRTDPAGVVADIAGMATGGAGGVAKVAGLSAKTAGLANTARKVANVASVIDPITGAIAAGKGVAKLATKAKIPQALMKSVLKPNQSDPLNFTDTILREKIPISHKGVSVLNERVGGLNSQIDDILAGAGSKVEPPLANELYRPSHELANKYLNPGQSTSVDKAMKAIVNQAGEFPKQFDSIEDVQAFKKNLYGNIDWKSDKFKTKVKNDYLRDAAANSRLAIEDVAREAGYGDQVHALNTREGNLIGARKPLEKTIHRVTNRNPIGLTSLITGASGGAMMGSPIAGVGAGLLTQALLNPRMGARVAQGLYNAGQGGLPANSVRNRAMVGASRLPGMLSAEEEDKLRRMGLLNQ